MRGSLTRQGVYSKLPKGVLSIILVLIAGLVFMLTQERYFVHTAIDTLDNTPSVADADSLALPEKPQIPTQVLQTRSQIIAPPRGHIVRVSAEQSLRLEWSPERLEPKVLDLCDDNDAIEAGLDGGDIVNDRQAMGIVCDSVGHHYGYLGEDGSLVFSDSEGATKLPNELNSNASDVPGVPGLLMGYRGPAFNDSKETVDGTLNDTLAVNRSSLRTVNGVTYGVMVNNSDLVADNVVIEVEGVRYEHPLSVQPGEAVPFTLDIGRHAVMPEKMVVDASLSSTVDLNRAVVVTGMPGIWVGDKEDLPAPVNLIDTSNVEGNLRYYETQIETRMPTSHGEFNTDVAVRSIEGLEVIVAFIDERGGVVGTAAPRPYSVIDDNHSQPVFDIKFGDTVSVGFLLPPDAVDVAIWVGGTGDS